MMLKKWLKNLLSLALTFLVMSTILDYWRKPNMPEHALNVAMQDLDQQHFFLEQISQDEPVLLYFWGTWCGYCRYTSPAINDLAQEGVKVVSVALRSGDEQKVRSYLRENQYQFTTVNDPNGEISRQWDISVTPTIILLKNGKMQSATTGLTSYWGIKVRLFLAEFF
ncbi:thioredoxin [Pasteurellaceae bacterium Pebbles2]|nr:thioredoxin [Pasteurellaceae bacterium Pebbles2]